MRIQKRRPRKLNIWLYIIRLSEDKYYVGQTNNINKRLSQHFNGNGSSWTKRYPPIEVLWTLETRLTYWRDALSVETEVAQKVAQIFGRENVRGGTFQ
jgi:predicted GIY-YIG superfamily endonuclease